LISLIEAQLYYFHEILRSALSKTGEKLRENTPLPAQFLPNTDIYPHLLPVLSYVITIEE
jgi:hypothetical protein